MFVFRGASRDEQPGVASKPSPAVASVTALSKRCYMRKRDNRIEPVAASPDAATPLLYSTGLGECMKWSRAAIYMHSCTSKGQANTAMLQKLLADKLQGQ